MHILGFYFVRYMYMYYVDVTNTACGKMIWKVLFPKQDVYTYVQSTTMEVGYELLNSIIWWCLNTLNTFQHNVSKIVLVVHVHSMLQKHKTASEWDTHKTQILTKAVFCVCNRMYNQHNFRHFVFVIECTTS